MIRTILQLTFLPITAIKNGDKKTAIKWKTRKIGPKTEKNLERILKSMTPGQLYRASEIADMLELKSSRTRELIAFLVEEKMIEAIGEKRDRRYRKK